MDGTLGPWQLVMIGIGCIIGTVPAPALILLIYIAIGAALYLFYGHRRARIRAGR